MTKGLFRPAAVAALLAVAPLSSALAWDHEPTGEEKAMISAALLDQGYVNWGKIKFDDGAWEVDDARTVDGRKHDVKLDRSLAVIDIDD